jgi:hypothetical protein
MPFLNPKLGIDFSNYIADRTRNFTGREWVFRAIHEWLSDPDGSRYFLLTGEPGSGKTAIAAQLIQISQGESTSSTLAPGFLSAFHFCSAGRSNWTDPRNFARSIALQLSTILEYAKALKDIGDKQVNIQVDIEVGEAKNTAIQGVVIKKFGLAGLSGQEAFNRVVLDPINILFQEGFEDKIIILIDSLDEALTYSGDKNIINIISELQDLSPNVRFICTTRPVRLVLSHLETLKLHKYPLVKDSQVNQGDLYEYIEARTNTEKIQSQLQEFNIEKQEFVNHLISIVDGNFLVAYHIFSEIEADRLALNNLSNALKGFDGIYQSFLRRFSQNDWDSNYQPILGILSVAQEALTEKQLRNFFAIANDARIDPTKLRRSLGILLQYLEIEYKSEDEEDEAYSLHHAALREYLLDEKRNQDFWCDAGKFHKLIIHFYQSFINILDASSLKKFDVYGRRHLAKHLINITLWDELIGLLTKQTLDGKNAWFKAKEEVGESASFLDDIELLIQNYPKELFSEEFKALTSIDALDYQVELIIKLASRYPNSVLPEALNIAIGSTDDHYKKRLLTALVDKFPEELLSKALEVALAIEDERSRAKALTALTYKLPEAFPQALASALAIQDEFHRAEALTALANIHPDVLPQALNAALSIQNESSRAKALTVLADKLPEAVLPALETIQSIWTESYRAKAFTALVDKLTPESLPQALRVVIAFEDERFRAETLISLVDKLPLELLPEALEIVETIQNEYYRAKALAALAVELPSELLPQVLITAGTFQNAYDRVKVLAALTGKIPELLPLALKVVQSIQDEYYRTQALTAIASHLPDNLSKDIKQQIFSITQAIQDDSYKAMVSAELDSYNPGIIEGVKLGEL